MRLQGRLTGNVKIRAKKPPASIKTKAEGREAFSRYVTYSEMARDANMRANWSSPGSNPFNTHIERERLYDDAAEEWRAVLLAWFDAN